MLSFMQSDPPRCLAAFVCVGLACTPSRPSPQPRPETAPAPKPDEGPDLDSDVALELRREAQWRILEWDLEYALEWSQLESGAIVLCPADSGCDPAERPRHTELGSLCTAIDEFAERYWAASDTPPLMAIRVGVPEVLGFRGEDPPLRDIDRMFWALTVLDLYWTDAEQGDGWALAGLSLGEAGAEVEWLAARYGLERVGKLSFGKAPPLPPGVELELPEDELVYGLFVRPEGGRYLCSLDAPPGKYCCYVHCFDIEGEDSLAEGH